MRTLLVACSALLLTAGAAAAGPKHYHDGKGGYSAGKVTPFERFAIRSAKRRLRVVKRRALRDGRITRYERKRIQLAKARVARVVRRAHRR